MWSKLSRCSSFGVILTLLAATAAWGQFRGFQAAVVVPPAPIALEAGKTVEGSLSIRIRPGYHINSNTPAEEYLIPTKLTWNTAGVETEVTYPESELFVSQFSEEAMIVFSGEVEFKTKFKASTKLPAGLTEIAGTLRYQACTDKACLAPMSVDVAIPIRSK
jgi:DsbC/DsbD-like thiol-disulfide interchange protein